MSSKNMSGRVHNFDQSLIRKKPGLLRNSAWNVDNKNPQFQLDRNFDATKVLKYVYVD